MSKELSKRAVDMLLNGATLVSEPCPYCKGIRVMKDGYALCVNCGKEPEIKPSDIDDSKKQPESIVKSDSTVNLLEQKLKKLSTELEKENNYEKQQEILIIINSLLEIIGKLKK